MGGPPEMPPLGWRNGACSSGIPALCVDIVLTDKPDFPAKLCRNGGALSAEGPAHLRDGTESPYRRNALGSIRSRV
jgi:hypothetical protein